MNTDEIKQELKIMLIQAQKDMREYESDMRLQVQTAKIISACNLGLIAIENKNQQHYTV